jgi:hypothetical protein
MNSRAVAENSGSMADFLADEQGRQAYLAV